MECIICHKGIKEGLALYRVNAKGQIGIWACKEHLKQTDAHVSKEVMELTEAIAQNSKP